MNLVTLMYGTDHVIKNPLPGVGSMHNDYGRGFYCTTDAEAASQWACKRRTDGVVNFYRLDMEGLRVLDLLDGQHTVLNWIALLLRHRTFSLASEIAIEAKAYLDSHFYVDPKEYDVVIGYRADDSYFSYAENFIENALSVRSLGKALRLGKLGTQFVLTSEESFRRLEYMESREVRCDVHFPRFEQMDSKARCDYRDLLRNQNVRRDDLFVLDIIREEIENDDPRIQRMLSV